MNPLFKIMLKQMEESAVMVEQYAKHAEKLDHWEKKMQFNDAFTHLHASMSAVKNIIQDLF